MGLGLLGMDSLHFILTEYWEKWAKRDPMDKNLVVLVSVAVSLSLAYVLNLTYGVAEILSAVQDPVTSYSKLSLSTLGWYIVSSFYGNSLESPER